MTRERHAHGAVFGALLGAAWAAKALCLGCVAGGCLPWALCDDVAVAAVLALLLGRAGRALRGIAVGAVLALTLLDGVLVRALGVPLLPSMLAGFAPAMADSALPYLDATNLLASVAVLAAAALGARVAVRVGLGMRGHAVLAAFAIVLAALVPPAEHLAHRNGVVAFARALLPRTVPSVPPPSPPSPEAAAPSAWHGRARGRSVVLVVLESAAARFVNPPDGETTAMPFLQSLQRDGLWCPVAWATYPESIEGQVALLCGEPPCPDAKPADYTAHAQSALPHRLRPHGYRSGLFHAGRFPFLGMHDVLAPMGFGTLADAGTIGGDHESSFGIDEEATVDALLRWVSATPSAEPVLACYLPIAGHHPYSSPPGGPFPRDTQLGCYRNALHYADRALQRLWRGLCALRPAEHWLLCVVGDHGQAFGEHPGNFGHSFELFEENLRVPLCFVAPGSGVTGVHGAPCSHFDVVPMLLELLGLPGGAALGSARGPVCAFTDWGELLVAARDGDWKLVHTVVGSRDRLFDLAADPGELHDLASQQPRITARLREVAGSFLSHAKTGPRSRDR